MRIVLISDTHGEHNSIRVPNGDILIHAGDLTPSGKSAEVEAAAKWLGSLPHRRKIAIAGNHDRLFESSPTHATSLLRCAGVTYLQDTGINIDGLSIYGSPWQPEYMHWAFNVRRGELGKYWDQIPSDLDILITHGPPFGILDQRVPPGVRKLASWEDDEPYAGSEHVGCEQLLAAVERTKPRFHVFGHIHGGYGTLQSKHTKFYNACICDEAYDPTNKPWVIELEPPIPRLITRRITRLRT
jgi:Icc-related predicted phosphoesterase